MDGERLGDYYSLFCPAGTHPDGLKIDSIPGAKNGWFVWLTSDKSLSDLDSVRLVSFRKEVEIPANGEVLSVEDPEIKEQVFGGIYVTPIQTGVGQLTLALSGVLVPQADGWVLDFPFLNKSEEIEEPKALTPITDSVGLQKHNPLKQKKK